MFFPEGIPLLIEFLYLPQDLKVQIVHKDPLPVVEDIHDVQMFLMDAVKHCSDPFLTLLLIIRLQQAKRPNLIVDPFGLMDLIFSLEYLSYIGKALL